MDSDNVITNLKIIKMINVNEKSSIRKGHLQIDYHPFQFIKRWFYNDSRDLVVLFIKDLINNVSHHKDNEMVIHEINGIFELRIMPKESKTTLKSIIFDFLLNIAKKRIKRGNNP